MRVEQLFRRARQLGDLESIQVELGSNYLELVTKYFLEENIYPNEIVESIKKEYDFLYEYKSYHIGYFLEDGRFFAFSGLSPIKHVEFNSKDLISTHKVAMIGSAFMPQMSLFIDVDKSSKNFEAIFIQSIGEVEDIMGRVYVAKNLRVLIDRLRFYMVGLKENLTLI